MNSAEHTGVITITDLLENLWEIYIKKMMSLSGSPSGEVILWERPI